MKLPLVPKDGGKQVVHCDFCGHSEHELERLVLGPRDIAICLICAETALEVMKARPAVTAEKAA